MYCPERRGILLLIGSEHNTADISWLARLIVQLFKHSRQISGDTLTGLYGQENSVAYEVVESGYIDLCEFSETWGDDIVFVYAHQDTDGNFINETIVAGQTRLTSFCNNNVASILRLMLFGSDEEDMEE